MNYGLTRSEPQALMSRNKTKKNSHTSTINASRSLAEKKTLFHFQFSYSHNLKNLLILPDMLNFLNMIFLCNEKLCIVCGGKVWQVVTASQVEAKSHNFSLSLIVSLVDIRHKSSRNTRHCCTHPSEEHACKNRRS